MIVWLFLIQASNPRQTGIFDEADYNLSMAIETVFPMNTEDALIVWNHIRIPLSYKYDLSCMMDDIIDMLQKLRMLSAGKTVIRWPSNTFEGTWDMEWDGTKLRIDSSWENVVGGVGDLLNANSKLVISKLDFISEWKEVLGNVILGLERSGYSVDRLKDIDALVGEFISIERAGILYR